MISTLPFTSCLRPLATAATLILAMTCSLSAATIDVATEEQLIKALSTSAPDTTITLAPGTYACPVAVPPGVTLRGSGYHKTIINATSSAAGVTLGDGARLIDLGVQTEGTAAISASGVKGLVISGVRVVGGATGMQFRKVSDLRVENCIIDGSQTGLALEGASGAEIVNNTILRTDNIGIALSRVESSAVFNNLVLHAGVAINISNPGDGLLVDHNLYLALYAGKYKDQVPRISIGPWRDVSGGLDAHSVSLPVQFRDSEKGDYQPVSALDWNSNIATTTGWGVPQLGTVKAPARDVAGDARPARPGVGAREAAKMPAVKTDGSFTVSQDTGTKSAGVFTKDGTMVRYLFRDLPLAKGSYDFVLPSRTGMGGNIADGAYELRLVEGNLGVKYGSMVANNGVAPGVDSDRYGLSRLAFAADGSLVFGGGWSERGENLRARDLTTGKTVWSLPGGSPTLGLSQGADGFFYALVQDNPKPVVLRLDNKGRLQPWPKGELRLPVPLQKPTGLAELAGVLYLTDADGQVYKMPTDTGATEPAFKMTRPSNLVADRKRGLLWMISGAQDLLGGKIVAVTPQGEEKYSISAVANPIGLAVNGDQLAIADYDAGKVRIFDIANPAAPSEQRTVGRGDGPYGPIVPGRMGFQKGPYSGPREVTLDLDADGRLAVLDADGRPLVFAADGSSIYMSMAQFGNAPFWARFPEDGGTSRFFDANSSVSWTVDATKGTWAADARWGRPELNGPGNTTIGFFTHAGKIYGVMNYNAPGRPGVLILRYDDYVGKIVAFYYGGEGGLRVVRDTDQDGVITQADGDGTQVLDTEGEPVNPGDAMARFVRLEANGDIRSETHRTWQFKGVDDSGYPLYDLLAGPAFAYDAEAVISPYSFNPETKMGSGKPIATKLMSESVIATDGDLLTGIGSWDAPNGMGLSNSGALDLARFRKDGSLRWYLPLNDFGPVQGVKQVTPGFILTGWGHQAEWIGLDEDGLSLGVVGFPAEAHWHGYWLDHPDHWTLFQGNDRRLHVMAGDYFNNGCHWFSLSGYDTYKKQAFPFAVSADRAAELAALPPVTAFMQAKSDKPKCVVKKLAGPLSIDGDIDKWRALGWAPQVVITPATGSASIKNARENSSVIRLAYHGNELYVQVLRFCEEPNFTQTIATGTNNNDTVEMMINTFMADGFQFSIGRFSTDGEQIVRRRFQANLTLNLGADYAPRIVKVLDSAQDVPERKLVEAATGEDLATCKVIVYEFKLPIDARTFAGSEQSIFPVESGKGFHVGFMIDSNDAPGTNQQKCAVWPASFNTFAGKENSAYVEFE